MQFWPFWIGGIFLAAVPLVHWLLLSKMFAVSGRLSALTDRLRGEQVVAEPQLADDELVRLLRAETASEFGGGCGDDEPALGGGGCGDEPLVTGSSGGVSTTTPSTTTLGHVLFLACVAFGGTLAYWHTTGGLPHPAGPDASFQHFFGNNLVTNLGVLFGGGLMVGFGTRMAGGCTSGHGLCGVSRLQPGSLLATACFFGCGIAVSLLLDAVVRP